MKLRPLNDRVIVEQQAADTRTPCGIIIPHGSKEKPLVGIAVAVGNGINKEDGSTIPLDIKAGDKVLFSKYAGVGIKSDDKDYLIMKEDDILAVIN